MPWWRRSRDDGSRRFDRQVARDWLESREPRLAELTRELGRYREHFRSAPLGRWRTSQGHADASVGSVWEFGRGGRGKIIRSSTYAGTTEQDFEWRRQRPFEIGLRPFRERRIRPSARAPGNHFVGGLDDEEDWVSIRYDFKIQELDVVGLAEVVLVVTDIAGGCVNDLGLGLAPLRYDLGDGDSC